ncbi:MAG: GntR family transcriptional regulator [Actinomycetota bacterium]
MVTTVGAATLTERVHSAIRSDVLSGRVKPDSPLRLAALAKRFDVSTAVVREALIRLAERRLVVLAPNQGFRVATISRQDLVDLTALRVLVEGAALRLSIENGSTEWEAQVIGAHHVLTRTPMVGPDELGTTDEWAIAHTAFHDALGAGCGNVRLTQMTHELRDSAELYRQLSIKASVESQRDVSREHHELMELTVKREADEAVTTLTKHLQRTTDLVLEHVLA